MAAEEYLSSELRRLLEGFTKVQDVYLALRTYCELQDERMSMEKERSEKLKANLENLYEAHSALQTRYKLAIDKFDKERSELRKTVEELREERDRLRSICTSPDQNAVSRLKDELEALKARLEMQESKHAEDVALLKQRHSDEIQRYNMLLNAKQGEAKKRGRGRNPEKAKRGVPALFRWPELKLNVEAVRKSVEQNSDNQEPKRSRGKKRKLFPGDKQAEVDIVQDE